MCDYSNFEFFNTQTRLECLKKPQTSEMKDILYLCPPFVLRLLNSHYFDRVFNLLSVMTTSLCSSTDIGNGSFVFLFWLYLLLRIGRGRGVDVIRPYHSPPTTRPLFTKNRDSALSVFRCSDIIAILITSLSLFIAVCKSTLIRQ